MVSAMDASCAIHGRGIVAQSINRPTRPTGHARLDDWFPTVVRYTGVAIVVFEVVIGSQRPAILATAAAMMGFKDLLDWTRHRGGGSDDE
jgi:hypothetical protein